MTGDSIANFIESLLPDEGQRRSVLSALADSIVEAGRLQPGSWGVSLRSAAMKIRFNVGWIEAMAISRPGKPVRVLLDDTAQSADVPTGGVLGPVGEYDSVKEARAVDIDPARFSDVWPAVREAHMAFLRRVLERSRGYNWKDSHSSAVLDYLRHFLGRDLPDPAYSTNLAPATGDGATAAPEEIVIDRLNQTYDRLLADGQLLPQDTLDACYARFRERFGPARLKSLDGTALLETMHDHGDRQSLVYWLEFKDDEELPGVFGGIAGGSALKFGIYRRKESGAWITGTNQKQVVLSQEQAIERARKHRDLLVAATEAVGALADSDDAAYAALQKRLDTLEIADTAWVHKYLHMLHPGKLDDYHTVGHQRFHLVKLLQVPPASQRYAAAGRYIALAQRLGWPVNHLTRALNTVKGAPYRYWRIGTGEGNDLRRHWPMMRRESVVAIGWPDLGDLSSMVHDAASREEIKRLLSQHYESTPQMIGRSAQQIFNFVTAIAEGHLVLASAGSQVLGIGRVSGPYQFVERAPFPHQRPVKWLNLEEWRMPEPEGLRTTVHEVRRFVQNHIEAERRLLRGGPPGESEPAAFVPALTPVVQTASTEPSAGDLARDDVPMAPYRAPRLEGIPGEIQRVLERKGQVILYGPPGTGKTHWAEMTACELAAFSAFGRGFERLSEGERDQIVGGRGTLVRMCCFHPSYGYEDFIEGHRPETSGTGALSFRLRDGIFKLLCRDAAKDPDRNYYLVVDEVNRGDIPRIFGELLTLLEPARRQARTLMLPLSGDSFSVPRNVYVIGTMNTADRSIALIDIALRRRFGFVELMPAPEVLGAGRLPGHSQSHPA